MYRLNVRTNFSAAHQLRGYNGACQRLHGHNWQVRVSIKCSKLNELGMAIDFTIIKKYLDSLMNEVDHRFLNDLEPFKNINPTSENIAKYFYERLSEMIEEEECSVDEIEVWESEKSSVIYSK